jgi:FtsZ-binding cell division protein ZapB
MRKVQIQNILTEKEAKLNTLMEQSQNAVSLITSTIDSLESVNQDIVSTVQEIDSYRTELDRIADSMTQQHSHNEKIIGKFKSFLED